MAVLSNAIYHALEVRLNRLTMSSGRVVETLRAKEQVQHNGGACCQMGGHLWLSVPMWLATGVAATLALAPSLPTPPPPAAGLAHRRLHAVRHAGRTPEGACG